MEKRIFNVRTKTRIELLEFEAMGFSVYGSSDFVEFYSMNDCNQQTNVASFPKADVISIMSTPKREAAEYAPQQRILFSDLGKLSERIDTITQRLPPLEAALKNKSLPKKKIGRPKKKKFR